MTSNEHPNMWEDESRRDLYLNVWVVVGIAMTSLIAIVVGAVRQRREK